MTRRRLDRALTGTFVALTLELLHEAGTYAPRLHHLTLATALVALFNVIRIISAGAAAMWANSLARVLYVHLLAFVQVSKRHLQANRHTRASPLLGLVMTSITAAEKVVEEAERILMLRRIRLVDALFAAAIELSALLSVNKYLMRC